MFISLWGPRSSDPCGYPYVNVDVFIIWYRYVFCLVFILSVSVFTSLQHVSIACYAERCMSYSKSVCLSVCLSVCPSVTRWH